MSDQHDDPGTLLARYVTAGDRRDFTSMSVCVAESVVTHSPGGKQSVGFPQLRRSWEAAHEGLRDLRHDVQEVLVSGTAAAARIVVTGIHAGPFLGIGATGAVVRVEQALFIRVASARITELWEVVDTGSGLRQLGVLGDQPLSP